MQFLAISRLRTELYGDEDFAPYLEEEAQRARQLYMDGHVRQIWYRGDIRGACSLIEAPDRKAALAHLETLPLVRAGMLEIQLVIPLQPYRGFGPR
ncbi:muconolactone Delta-isomerase family protein [Bordetella genomosp. 9]|uniref:Muconolactone isomerase domain-containing protein n=1 Tax=Bordetella genomosp. 9 TaxID=1416803 RepID=A0A1W6Z578_9BORD|nr:muconolactone Delta-isomerase family protein [Bordetella genomosp. 9]ARP87953.1 hypothetical protein CAL13_18335 [Bordetella genomosp. 9]